MSTQQQAPKNQNQSQPPPPNPEDQTFKWWELGGVVAILTFGLWFYSYTSFMGVMNPTSFVGVVFVVALATMIIMMLDGRWIPGVVASVIVIGIGSTALVRSVNFNINLTGGAWGIALPVMAVIIAAGIVSVAGMWAWHKWVKEG